jgi:hypothetical protein
MTGEMDLDALRQEALTPALAPPGEGGAPTFSAHPRAKSVLLFPGALRAL